MGKDKGWLAPLTGVAFLVLAIVAIVVYGGEPPSPGDDSTRELIDFYVDNKDSVFFGAALGGVAGTLLVFFGGVLRRVLRDAEGEHGTLSAVSFAGTIIIATGIAIDGTISFALAETAEDVDPAAVQALSALWENDFLPLAVGMQIFLLATGISVLRHGALPKWIGWVAILLAVISVTPIGFAGFIGGGILIAIVSVLLTVRGRASAVRPPPSARADV